MCDGSREMQSVVNGISFERNVKKPDIHNEYIFLLYYHVRNSIR